jgi:hypothetical protein
MTPRGRPQPKRPSGNRAVRIALIRASHVGCADPFRYVAGQTKRILLGCRDTSAREGPLLPYSPCLPRGQGAAASRGLSANSRPPRRTNPIQKSSGVHGEPGVLAVFSSPSWVHRQRLGLAKKGSMSAMSDVRCRTLRKASRSITSVTRVLQVRTRMRLCDPAMGDRAEPTQYKNPLASMASLASWRFSSNPEE